MIKTKQVAEALGKSSQTIRCMMQAGELAEIGKAYKMPGNQKWSYVFYPEPCKRLLGI